MVTKIKNQIVFGPVTELIDVLDNGIFCRNNE